MHQPTVHQHTTSSGGDSGSQPGGALIESLIKAQVSAQLGGVLHSMAVLALPRISNAVCQLGHNVRQVRDGPTHGYLLKSRHFHVPLAPLLKQPLQRLQLQLMAQQHPGLGATPEQVADNFAKALQAPGSPCDQGGEVEAPEEVLLQLQLLRGCSFMEAVQRLDSFLHAAVMSCDALVANLLAAPRALKLAACVLYQCQYDLSGPSTPRYYNPDHEWCWSWSQLPADPADRQRVAAWIGTVLQMVPELGPALADFATAADAVQDASRGMGPDELRYGLQEIQRRVGLCQQAGMLNSMQREQPFAYHTVTYVEELRRSLPA